MYFKIKHYLCNKVGTRLGETLQYYAHLNEIKVEKGDFVTHKSLIGTVGNTGSAAKTPSHLHFTIFTFVPYPWRIDTSTDGWKKMFYLNPIDYLEKMN